MRDDAAPADLGRQFRTFAAVAERDGAPLYRRICEGVAGDGAVLRLVGQAPPSQRRPNLLLAAVHFLLLQGADDPLAAHYPTVAEWLGRPPSAPSGDPFAAFSAFCRRHHDALAGLLATRSTQTNEVGRCTALLPGLVTVAARSTEPLSLVDLGSAAGLNLLFDRYAYAYSGPGPAVTRAGAEGSAVLLEAELRHGPLPDLSLPEVAHRAGIDAHPVDPDDLDRSLWLLACQWPDHPGRFRRTARALDLARATADRPRVAAGDVVDDLASVASTAPPGTHLCLFHSWVAAYLSPTDQARLAAEVAAAARERAVSWLYAEQPYEVPALDPPPAPAGEDKAATALVLVELDGRRRTAVRLADVHPHGRWIRWWGRPG